MASTLSDLVTAVKTNILSKQCQRDAVGLQVMRVITWMLHAVMRMHVGLRTVDATLTLVSATRLDPERDWTKRWLNLSSTL
jgi:hypothetical protein